MALDDSVQWGLLRLPIVPLPDDDTILGVLTDQWATVAQIRGRICGSTSSIHFAKALGRLATAGKIERKLEETIAPKRNADKQMQLSYYRRLPPEG